MTALTAACMIGAAAGLLAYASARRRRDVRGIVEEMLGERAPGGAPRFPFLRRSGSSHGTPRLGRRRRVRFDDELPDALELCAGSLEAGASLDQALELVAADGRPPLSEELTRALAESRLGVPITDALEHAAARIGSREFTWVVRAVRAQQEFGASLAAVLRTAAETIRARGELRREVRALTAEGRISAIILIALPFVVAAFFTLANPAYLGTLFASPLGWTLLATAGVLMTGGFFWMRRIVRVEV